jgi:hypothetical protein
MIFKKNFPGPAAPAPLFFGFFPEDVLESRGRGVFSCGKHAARDSLSYTYIFIYIPPYTPSKLQYVQHVTKFPLEDWSPWDK